MTTGNIEQNVAEKTRYTRYYEHDGMLRAYANRSMVCRWRRERGPVWRAKGSQLCGYALTIFAGPAAPLWRLFSGSQFVPVPGNCIRQAHNRLAHARRWAWVTHRAETKPDSTTHSGFCLKPVRASALRPAGLFPSGPAQADTNHPQLHLPGVSGCPTATAPQALQAREASQVFS
jgi:hypothetical protein